MALALPTHVLRVGDDALEYIIGIVVSDGPSPQITLLRISHISRQFRRLILARASFWTSLEICGTTRPELIHLVLERSHELPLKIWVSFLEVGNELTEDGRLHAVTQELLNALHHATPRFAQSETIRMIRVDNAALAGFHERLAVALGPNQPAAQLLELCAVSCDPLLGLFGPRLTQLTLIDVRDFSLRWLHSVLRLASNIVVLKLDSPCFNDSVEGDRWSPEPFEATSVYRLRVLDVDIFEQDDFSQVVELVQRHYPSILFAGRIVLLKSYDDGLSVDKLDLQRLAPAVCLNIGGGFSYEVRYPRSTIAPQGSFLARDYETIDGRRYWAYEVVRGFNCWPESLQHDGPYLNAVRQIASTVHTLQLHHIDLAIKVRGTETLLAILARVSWPLIHHLSMSVDLHKDLPANIISQSQRQLQPRNNLPRLSALDIHIKLRAPDDKKTSQGSNWDPYPECLLACHALLLGFGIPDSVLMFLSVEIDGEPVTEVFSRQLMSDLRTIEGIFMKP